MRSENMNTSFAAATVPLPRSQPSPAAKPANSRSCGVDRSTIEPLLVVNQDLLEAQYGATSSWAGGEQQVLSQVAVERPLYSSAWRCNTSSSMLAVLASSITLLFLAGVGIEIWLCSKVIGKDLGALIVVPIGLFMVYLVTKHVTCRTGGEPILFSE